MKKAFTLIEVLISIFLFALIMIFIYKSISNLQLNNKNLLRNSKKNSIISKVIYLLKNDLILSKEIKINNDKNQLILKTINSIHNNSQVQVSWIILKQTSDLIRVEKSNNKFYVEKTNLKCKKLKIYKSNKQKILVFIETKNNKKILFEVISTSIKWKISKSSQM